MNRTSHIRSAFYLFAATLLLVACAEKGIYDAEHATLTLQPHVLKANHSSLVFDGNTGGDTTLDIHAVNTEWEIIGMPDWLKVSKSSTRSDTTETVTITATPNISAIARTTVIYVKSTEEDWAYSLPITVTQPRAIFYITPSTTSLTFNGGASSQTIDVTTLTDEWNFTPIADLTDWCTVIRPDRKHLQVSVKPNTLSVSRTGHIQLTTDTRSAIITVTQRPAGIKGVYAEVSFEQAGGSKQLGTITSEAPWTAKTSDDWLSLTPSKSEAGSTQIAIHARANNSMEPRTGYVYLIISEENKQEIKVVQEGITFSVSPVSFTFPAAGKDEERLAEFTITTNAPWTTTGTIPDWIILSKDKGDGTDKVRLIVRSNPSDEARTATINIRPKAINSLSKILVRQHALNISVTGDEMNFSSEGGSQQMQLNSNGAWSALASPTAWFSVTPSSGTGSATLTVKAQPNTGKSSRQGNLLVSCGEVNKTYSIVQTGTWLEISSSAFQFTSKGGSETLTLNTNKKWEAKKSVSWITLSATTGEGDCELKVTVADNPSLSSRSGTITITTSDGKTVTARVKQDGRYLNVATESVTFPNAGGKQTVEVSTDGTFNVTSSANWLSFTKYSGSFLINAAENTEREDREADIVVSLTDLKEGKLEHTIHVRQTQADYLEVSHQSLSYETTGGTRSIRLNTNLSWTASTSSSWISLSSKSGSGSASITITAADNPSVKERTGYVTFRSGTHSQRVDIKQEARALSVETQSLSFASGGGRTAVIVRCNADYEATSSADWITVTFSSSKAYINIKASQNSSNLARAGSVTISVPGLTDGTLTHTIEVTQEAAPTELSADVESLSFPYVGGTQSITLTANGTWTAKTSPISYFTVSPTSGTGSATLTVSAKENTTSLSRTGTLTLSCGGEMIQIKLVQDKKANILLPATLTLIPDPSNPDIPYYYSDMEYLWESEYMQQFRANSECEPGREVIRYESPVMSFPYATDRLMFTVLHTVGDRTRPEGIIDGEFPFFNINEFYLYDADGNKIELNNSCFYSNAYAEYDGAYNGLCDGTIEHYFHTRYQNDGPNDYHNLCVFLPQKLTSFKFALECEWENANRVFNTPTQMKISTGDLIAPTSDISPWRAKVKYSTIAGTNWTLPNYNDSSWPVEETPFEGELNDFTTKWHTEFIYIRRTVTLTDEDLQKHLAFTFSNDDDIQIYVNGTLVIECGLTNGEWRQLTDEQRALFHVGENLIAVRCYNSGGGPGYVDFGLYCWE